MRTLTLPGLEISTQKGKCRKLYYPYPYCRLRPKPTNVKIVGEGVKNFIRIYKNQFGIQLPTSLNELWISTDYNPYLNKSQINNGTNYCPEDVNLAIGKSTLGGYITIDKTINSNRYNLVITCPNPKTTAVVIFCNFVVTYNDLIKLIIKDKFIDTIKTAYPNKNNYKVFIVSDYYAIKGLWGKEIRFIPKKLLIENIKSNTLKWLQL